MSLWGLFWQSTFFVKIIMLFLFFMSVYSWALMFKKRSEFSERTIAFIKFSNFFEKKHFKDLYEQLKKRKENSGIENIFVNSIGDYNRTKDINIFQDSFEREVMEENIKMEKGISMISTIASVAPYIGLVGTVIGIMHSFISLSSVKQVTIAEVAPGIAEALFATGIGLFVAIPAYIGANILKSMQNEMLNKYDLFGRKIKIKLGASNDK